MGVLQRFERRLEGLVEGVFAKMFKGYVQPAEIAQALQKEAGDKRAILDAERILVPNEFFVELGGSDHERLSPYAEPLGAELAAMLEEHAAEVGWSFVGPVRVQLEEHQDLGTGMFRVRSDVLPAGRGRPAAQAAAPAARPADPSATAALPAFDVAPTPPPRPAPSRHRLVVLAGGQAGSTGQFHRLDRPLNIVGRGADADVRLLDSSVSRRHAEIRVNHDTVTFTDLGSTNGSEVNGRRADRTVLQDGDRLRLGSTTLIYRRDDG